MFEKSAKSTISMKKKTLLSVKYTGWISCILAKKLFYLKKKHKIENLEIENIKLM